MGPLSAIVPTLPAYATRPLAEMTVPETPISRTPGVQGPSPLGPAGL